MRALLGLLLLGVACVHAPGQEGQEPPFAQEARGILDAAESDGAIAAAWVADAQTGALIFEHRSGTRLLPASTMKVVTTAAALAHLGEEFRFRTPVSLEGRRRGELFEGAVVVKAAGDPSLGSWRWEQTRAEQVCSTIASALGERGIRRWNGPLVIEGAGEPVLGPGWAWDDAVYDYSAAPSTFVFHENVVELRLQRGRGCATPRVEVHPHVVNFLADVVVEAATGRSVSCQAVAGGTGARCRWRHPVESCPREASFRLAVPVAERVFESCVRSALVAEGIAFDPTPPGILKDAQTLPLVELLSPPLSELVRVTNKESLNIYAERLALELARHFGDESFEGVRSALVESLRERGVEPRDVVAVDGSGLSRYNLATARALGQVMLSSLREPSAEVMLESLPVAGVDGTLAARRLSQQAIGRVRAKSGSMTGQRAWTGVAERPGDESHPRVVFALMFGNTHAPAVSPNELFERFAEALVSAPMH